MNNLVSIIIPTYNRGYIIKNAIKSVLNQTYPNWELLIVDDGSTDNTKEIVKSFRDKRIHYLKQNKSGQGTARNKGLNVAKGKWIAFLDSDNELLPQHLEKTINIFNQNKEVLYILPKGNRLLELYENGKLIKSIDDSNDFPKKVQIKDIFLRKLHFDLNGFIHSSLIRDREIRFDTKISAMEDWDYMMQIANLFPRSFLYLPFKLYTYHQRYGGDGVVSNTSYKGWADIFEYIYQKHKNDELMKGQKWYPDRVNKWNKIAEDYKKGKAPPPHLYRFRIKR